MGLFSKLFGGSKQSSLSTSKSGNSAYNFIGDNFGGVGAETFKRSQNEIGNSLNGGFERYADKIGLDFLLDEGMDKIGGGASGRGVFNSGATGRGLMEYGTNIKKTFLNDYLEKLFQNANQGLDAGRLYSGAGAFSESTSRGTGSSTNGIAGFIGQLLGSVGSGGK